MNAYYNQCEKNTMNLFLILILIIAELVHFGIIRSQQYRFYKKQNFICIYSFLYI